MKLNPFSHLIVATILVSAITLPQVTKAADATFADLTVSLSSLTQGTTDITVQFTMGDENLSSNEHTTPFIEVANVLTTIADGGSASVIDFSDASVTLGDDLTDRVEFLSFVTSSQVTLTITDVLLAGETYTFTIHDAMIDGSSGGYAGYRFYISNQTSDIDELDLWLASNDEVITQNDDYGSAAQMDKPTVNHINASSATVHWDSAPYQSAVENFIVRITDKQGNLVKKYTTTRKKRSHRFSDKLGPETVYYASVRALYETGDLSEWSSKKKFTTEARQLD